MAYNKSTLARMEQVRTITMKHYEVGNQSRCYKAVWRSHIYPKFGICYHTYLSYIGRTKSEREAYSSRLSPV